MYYQESDILLRKNPEYERYIIKLDKKLGSMGQNEGKQLKIEVISDITEIKPEIIEFIFNYYCKVGILNIKKYILCPDESVFLNEIDDVDIDRFPIRAFCDICGTEHIFTKDDIEICYTLNKNKNDCAKEKMDHVDQTQPINGEMKSSDIIIDTNPNSINLENFFISKEAKCIVKIATVQLDYTLSHMFPFRVINKDSIREKIEVTLKKAAELGVDIICFPELCLCEEWLNSIESDYPNIAIIPGTYYDNDNHNTCKFLIDPKIQIPNQMKIKPSEFENSIITGIGMISGDKIFIYETKFGKMSILICRDFGNFIEKLANKIDIVFVPSYNSSPNRFEEIAHSHVSNHPSYIIISNAAIFGGTSIFGQMDKAHFNLLVQAGCKGKDSTNYKLCEIKKGTEGIIIAEFNIKHKSIQKPTPINPDEATRSVINIKQIGI